MAFFLLLSHFVFAEVYLEKDDLCFDFEHGDGASLSAAYECDLDPYDFSGNGGYADIQDRYIRKVIELDKYVFQNCLSLIKVRIPEAVEVIRDYAFDGCVNLKTVELNCGTVDIRSHAFYGCTSLQEFTINNYLFLKKTSRRPIEEI